MKTCRRKGRALAWLLVALVLAFAAVFLRTPWRLSTTSMAAAPVESPGARPLAAAEALTPDLRDVGPTAATSGVKVLEPTPVHRLSARNLVRRLPILHITRAPLTEETAATALDIFLERLDFDRSIFLASDVEEFRGEIPRLVPALKEGNLDFPFRVFALYKNRLRNRVRFVESLLDQPLDFSVSETYHWKRRTAPWPATVAEWDDLWRRKVKNDVLARQVAQALQEEEASRKKSDSGAVTNATPSDTWDRLSPTAFVRKRYQQTLMIIEDHEAEWLVQTYLSAFAQAYDPHTEYFSPETQEDFDIDMKLSLSGVGAVLMPEDGFPKVVRIIPGGGRPIWMDGSSPATASWPWRRKTKTRWISSTGPYPAPYA